MTSVILSWFSYTKNTRFRDRGGCALGGSETRVRSTVDGRSKTEGRTVDTLAHPAEEGRGRQRNSLGSGQHAVIQGYPNGATRQAKSLSTCTESIGVRR